MKPSLFRQLLVAALVLAVSANSRAASLQRRDLPAEPSWLIHLDCDALRPTSIGQFVLSELDKPKTQEQLASFQSVFNLDPRTQLHGLTLYSLSGTPEDGVLLVYADFDPERLTALAQGATDHESTTHNQHVIHSWIGQEKRSRKSAASRVYAAIHERRVIFGQRENSVASALDVLDGSAPNLSSTKSYAQMGRESRHCFLQGAARKLEFQDSGPHAAIFRLAKGLRLEMGEAQQQATATLFVEANSDDVAGQIAAVGQGLLALVKLQSEKPEAAKLAEAISLKQDGATVVAKVSMPASTAIELFKADEARKEQKRAARKRARAD